MLCPYLFVARFLYYNYNTKIISVILLCINTVDSNITDWSYLSYEKIPENFNKLGLTESDYRLFNKTDWVVTEKIHGANFGICTDGFEVRFAKRKEFLQPGEDFLAINLYKLN